MIRGTYTITQLAQWYDTLRSEGIWDQNGVITTDLNEGRNKLYVGIIAEDNISGVQIFLDKAGIPREAVIIEVELLETPMSGSITAYK